MMWNRKIPAFTLMEVTIAMLIAAVAIGITFTAYRIVTGSYLGFSKKQEELAGFVRLDKLLKQDFEASSSIVKTSEGLVMQLEGGQISYKIDPAFLVRNQFSLRVDTFKLATDHTGFSFENNSVADGGLIDQFGFETVVQGQHVPLHYLKLYSAQDLFK